MKYFLALILPLFAALAQAQLQNGDLSQYTAIQGQPRLVPVAWSCANYPARSAVCSYTPGSITLLSTQAGATATARMAYPAAPSWWQALPGIEPGLYTLRYTLTKTGSIFAPPEAPYQAVTAKIGATLAGQTPHEALPLGVPVQVEQSIMVTAPGVLSFGLARGGPARGAISYSISDVVLSPY